MGHEVAPATSKAGPRLAGGGKAPLDVGGVDGGLVKVPGLGGGAGEHERGAEEHALGACGEYQVARMGSRDEGAMCLDVESSESLAESG